MNDKKKQLRKTRFDSLNAQKRMRKIVLDKIQHNTPLASCEKDDWMDIVADALLTWGKNIKAYVKKQGVRIPLGSVHTFALYFLDWDNPVPLEHMGDKYKCEIKELWELLYKYMLEIFPYALDEALHISKEDEEREERSSYGFTHRKSLESPDTY